jgi:hypothetical protein
VLNTAKGPAVVELEFNSPSLTYSSETVTDLEEIAPVDVPDDDLTDVELVALAKAFVARGGTPARSSDLDEAFLEAPDTDPVEPSQPKAIKTPAATREQRDATKRLRCVQKAHGDIEKLQRCATI